MQDSKNIILENIKKAKSNAKKVQKYHIKNKKKKKKITKL